MDYRLAGNLWRIIMFRKIANWFVESLGKVHWDKHNLISEYEKEHIRKLLGPNYYIILTRRNNQLSTYFIAMAHFLLTGRLGYWSHSLMNLEGPVASDDDFRLIEALGTGVQYTPFERVFDVNSVALLRPKHITIDDWTAILDRAAASEGKPYDTLFDLKSDSSESCVEAVRNALKAHPEYDIHFAEFERMIRKRKNLTPSMFYECSDFEVVYEVRRK